MTSVLLLHGLGGSGEIWGPVRDLLGDGVDIVAPDLAGGQSMQDEAADALDALNGRDGVIAVGHSMGGLVATALAERVPERVAALVLINTPPTLESRLTAHSGSERLIGLPVVGRLLWGLAGEDQRRAGLRTAVAPGVAVPDELITALTRTGHRAFTGSTEAVDRYLAAASLHDRLARLNTPVSIIFGTEDQRVARSSLAGYTGLNHVDVLEVPGVGHTPPLERPVVVADVIADVIARLVRKRAAARDVTEVTEL